MIWVHVALPLNENGAVNTQARIPNLKPTHAEVKRQKIEILQYCLGFVYAVKHYLRGEDGAHHGDLARVLPPHFSLHGDLGYTTKHGHPSVLSYAATQGSTSDTSINDRRSVDATKRVKRKRSKSTNPQAHTPHPTTPLLSDSHQTVEFHPYADRISIPLPLMFVFLRSYRPPSFPVHTFSSSIAHEITSAIFRFKREGLLETVGPAGKSSP